MTTALKKAEVSMRLKTMSLTFLLIWIFIVSGCQSVPITSVKDNLTSTVTTDAGIISRVERGAGHAGGTFDHILTSNFSSTEVFSGKLKTDAFGSVTIKGIAQERLLVHQDRFPVEDGKSCTTGQEPYTKEEAKLVYQFELNFVNSTRSQSREFIVEAPVLNPDELNRTAKRFNKNCRIGVCNFHLANMSFVCGSVPPLEFPNGVYCADGTRPERRKHVAPFFIEEDNYPSITSKRQADLNEYFTIIYGQHCKSKRCVYMISRWGAICGSTSLQPFQLIFFILIFLLAGSHL